MNNYEYYEVTGQIKNEALEILFGSFELADVKSEKQLESATWRADGYRNLTIRKTLVANAPDPEVYGNAANFDATAKPAERKYYAVEWSCGRAVCAQTGRRYGASYHSFATRILRNEWCQQGGDFTSSAGWRESVLSTDRELRRDLRNQQQFAR